MSTTTTAAEAGESEATRVEASVGVEGGGEVGVGGGVGRRRRRRKRVASDNVVAAQRKAAGKSVSERRVATLAVENPVLGSVRRGSFSGGMGGWTGIEFTSEASDYELGELVGSGASSRVYWGEYRGAGAGPMGVHVAVKVIELDSLDVDLAQVSTALRSASIMHHDKLLDQFASFVVGSQLWIVTERAEVGSVRDVMTTVSPSGFADEQIIAALLYQVVEALVYLHDSDLIHRDLKSSNLLLADDGRVLVGDLGTARLAWGAYSRSKTLAGSPCFMAPEVLQVVLQNSEGYDSKADIWSLGITAIELATGLPPYHDESILTIMARNSKKAPDLKSTLTSRRVRGRTFSANFRSFVHSCLHIEPSQRKPAKDLLRHKLFKSVRAPGAAQAYLVAKLISLVPAEPLPARYSRMAHDRIAEAVAPTGASVGMWQFDAEELDGPFSGAPASPFSAPATPPLAQPSPRTQNDHADTTPRRARRDSSDSSDSEPEEAEFECDLSSFDSDASDFFDADDGSGSASASSSYTYTDDDVAVGTTGKPTGEETDAAADAASQRPRGAASDSGSDSGEEVVGVVGEGEVSGDSWEDW